MSLDFIKQRKNNFVPLALLAIGLGLLIYNSVVGPGRRVSPLSRAILEVLSYPQALVTNSATAVGDTWHHYIYLRGVESENRYLRDKLDSLMFENRKFREEIARLRMGITGPVWRGAKLLPAKIIALSARNESRVATINRGSDDGIKYGLPVVCGAGTVGKIVGGAGTRSVPPHSAQVLLLIDPRCRVDALMYRLADDNIPNPACPWNPSNWTQTRIRGVTQGDGKRLVLKFVERGSDVQPGDMVVSSGFGGVFPKGLLLGRVSRVGQSEKGLRLMVDATPVVDFNTIEEVQVMIKEGDPIR